MTTLTATNERVQAYLNAAKENGVKPSTNAKKARMEMLQQLVASFGQFISELFPRKQAKVLDELVYLTAATGIAKISAASLAKRADVSERTVSTVVSKLKKTDDYIVARLNSGQAGKYIFVDKKNANFENIMQFVFGKDATQFATQNAVQFASLKPLEIVEPQGIEGENDALNCFNCSNSFNELDIKDITEYNENAVKTEGEAVKKIDKEQVRKEALISKVPTALEQVELFFDNADDIYEMNGVIFLAKNSVSKTLRIEEHENLFAQTIKHVFEYYKRKVKDTPDYNVFGLMRKAIKELAEKIVNGTAYAAPEEDKAVNGVTQSMIDATEDVFEKQRLINQRNAVKTKKPTGRVEKLPEWFEDAATHWKKVEEKRKAEQAAKYAGMSEEEELKAIYANVADFIGITFEEFKAQQLEGKTVKQEVAQTEQAASSEEEDLEAAAARVRAKLGLS